MKLLPSSRSVAGLIVALGFAVLPLRAETPASKTYPSTTAIQKAVLETSAGMTKAADIDIGRFKLISSRTGASIAVETSEYKGRKSLRLPEGAIATVDGLMAKDFTIEFDVHGKNMTFVGFRAKDPLNAECAFFRLMAGGTNESVQYLPRSNGSTPWRLYSKYQASCLYKKDDWNHIKIEVVESCMKAFVNDSSTPDIEILPLKRIPESGRIFFQSSFGDSYIANVTVSDLPSASEKRPAPKRPDKRYLNEWLISDSFEEPFLAERLYRKMKDAVAQWKPIHADQDGLVDLTRYFANPTGTVFVKTYIDSADAAERTLFFDYSYALGIILNNETVFYGRELDSKNMGRVEEDEEKLVLRLKKGRNELVFAIKGDYETLKVLDSMAFNRIQSMNWGFVARLDSSEGIETSNKTKEEPLRVEMPAAKTDPTTTAIEKAILEANTRITEAANSLNAEAFFEYILDSDKGVIIQNGVIFKTRSEALEAVKRGFVGIAKLKREIENPRVTVITPELAVLTGEGNATATLHDGRTITSRFAVSLIFQRNDGQWKILQGHYSTPVQM